MTPIPEDASQAVELPPLPEPCPAWGQPERPYFTADQMNERWADGWKACYKHGAWADQLPQAAVEAVPEEIAAIIERLHTQDNRITDNPLFAVQQKHQICGLDDGYEESWVWVNSDCEEVRDEAEVAPLNAAFDKGEDTPGYRRVGVAERWEFVTGCLTEAGCKDYIRANGHNLREPRIYAYGSYRNVEFIAVRKWLMGLRSLATPTQAAPAAVDSDMVLVKRSLLGIVRTARAQASRVIDGGGDSDDIRQSRRDLPITFDVIEHALAAEPVTSQAAHTSESDSARCRYLASGSRCARPCGSADCKGEVSITSQVAQREIRALIANDAWAMSFQTMGQYRTALLAALASSPAAPEPTLPLFANAVSRCKWETLQSEGQRMQYIAFDGPRGAGTIDAWSKVLWVPKAHSIPAAAPEPVLAGEDTARLDWLDGQKWAYGFADVQEGNRWEIEGAYKSIREAIDAARAPAPAAGEPVKGERNV